MTNCPPVYRNIQCESFGNKKQITSQLLRQFCKNDAYLYEQIQELWDNTDPESRKRFYPPSFMDLNSSYGIESYILITDYEKEQFDYWDTVYRFSQKTNIKYYVDFDSSNDKIIESGDTRHIYTESILDFDGEYTENKLEVVREEDEQGNIISTLRPEITTETAREIIEHKAQYETKYVKKATEQLGKQKKDAYCYGAYGNWHCNSYWYSGFNRSKNYNIKSAWRKNQDTYDIPSVCRSQTFTAENTGRVNKVSLKMQGDSTSISPTIVEIRTTTKTGKPSTKVLARTEKRFTHNTGSVIAFEFKEMAKIEKGKKYAIVVRSPLSNFGKTVRWGGWARTCFSNAKKQAYYKGDAFLSEDNGKTWIKYGKNRDGKSYGSHWYDWGIAEKPLDFGFEVFIRPITEKKINTKTNKLVKSAYNEELDVEYSYFKKGIYYLNFHTIYTSNINDIYISEYYHENREDTSLAQYTWQYYNPEYTDETDKWLDVQGNHIQYSQFTNSYSFLKLRLKLELKKSTMGNITIDNNNPLRTIMTEKGIVNDPIPFLDQFEIHINCRHPTRAYLRTQYYHPPKENMLGASLWSEVNATAIAKNNATVDIDIIHEKEAIEHFKFYQLETINVPLSRELTIKQQEIVEELNDYINAFENTSISRNQKTIIQYIINDNISEKLFLNYLKIQLTPVYILPFTYEDEEYLFFDKIELPHYPAKPLLKCDVGDEDITINTSNITGKSDYGAYYSVGKDISKTISRVYVSYYTNLTVENEYDENGYELNNIDYEERNEETLIGIVLENDFLTNSVVRDVFDDGSVDYALSKDGKNIVFNFKSEVIKKIFPNRQQADFTPIATIDNLSVNDFLIKIDLASKSYEEVVDFEVDYDDASITFYNPKNLQEGDFKVTYNPLWVRGLSIADFPLKMDLWKEEYVVVNNDDEKGIYKRVYNVDDGLYVKDTFFKTTNVDPYTHRLSTTKEFYTFRTKVPPLDNIRKLTINGEELKEDSHFFVDYLANEIIIYNSTLNDGDIINIHYTPNLTDNGLALAYRLNRPRYARDGTQMTSEEYNPRVNTMEYDGIADDVYIGLNWFTYRT